MADEARVTKLIAQVASENDVVPEARVTKLIVQVAYGDGPGGGGGGGGGDWLVSMLARDRGEIVRGPGRQTK